jgi:hypothetical protein
VPQNVQRFAKIQGRADPRDARQLEDKSQRSSGRPCSKLTLIDVPGHLEKAVQEHNLLSGKPYGLPEIYKNHGEET